MKRLVIFAVTLVAAVLAGCDGHARLLYLKPATAMKSPPWGVASVVIAVDESENVEAIVSKVAADLGLRADSKEANRWWIEVGAQNTFTLWARKEDAGYWSVSLLDWPTCHRSQLSVHAESLIRAGLKRPNQTPEPTPTAARPPAGAGVAPAAVVAHL